MKDPIAFFDGQWIPFADARLPVADAGFVQGTTVAEQLRTFGGRLFRLDEHLDRLYQALEIVDVDCGYAREDLAQIAERVVDANFGLEPPERDLGLCIFVTPGLQPAEAFGDAGHPLVCMYTKRLAFHLWAGKFREGEKLATTGYRQVPTDCWPAELKCRSRMHYYLADKEAHRRFPGARAVICDHQDHALEASTANLVIVHRDEGIVSPPLDQVLPGISLATLKELAAAAGIPFAERAIPVTELAKADEILLCSTSVCVLPCVEVDGRPVGDGRPGPVYQRILKDWGEMVGLDIAGQAERFQH